MTSIALLSTIALLAPSYGPQQVKLPSDLAAVADAGAHIAQIARFFARDQRAGTLEQRAIPERTLAFSESALKRSIRDTPTGLRWTGYFTADRQSEVMTTSWSTSAGSYTWLDNGQFATVRFESKTARDLPDADSAVALIQDVVKKTLAAPEIERSKIKHWLKEIKSQPHLWAGIYDRDVQTSEVTLDDGTKMLRIDVPPKWHQHLNVATDGRAVTIYFQLDSPQSNPNGNNPAANSYVPFRFKAR